MSRHTQGPPPRRRPSNTSTVMDRLNDIQQTLDAVERVQKHQARKVNRMAKTITELLDAVRRSNTVEKSLQEYIKVLKQKLNDALAKSITPEQQADIDAAFAEIEAQAAESAEAILEDTPNEDPGGSTGGVGGSTGGV